MEYYDTIASGYNELYREEQVKKYRLIQRYLNIRKDDILLDVGCGTGISSEVFKCRIIGIEPAREMLRQINKDENVKGDFFQGLAEQLPFKNNIFDIVVCVTAIHNFNDPRMALEEIKRVGKGKGAITILRKSERAEKLRDLVGELLNIYKTMDEDKDIIIFFSKP